MVTLRGLILLGLRWKGSPEAASVLSQASALLSCAGFVVGWDKGDRPRWPLLLLLATSADLPAREAPGAPRRRLWLAAMAEGPAHAF